MKHLIAATVAVAAASTGQATILPGGILSGQANFDSVALVNQGAAPAGSISLVFQTTTTTVDNAGDSTTGSEFHIKSKITDGISGGALSTTLADININPLTFTVSGTTTYDPAFKLSWLGGDGYTYTFTASDLEVASLGFLGDSGSNGDLILDLTGNLYNSNGNNSTALLSLSVTAQGGTDFDADWIGHAQLKANGTAVPEASTWALMLVGFGAMGASMRRRKVDVTFA